MAGPVDSPFNPRQLKDISVITDPTGASKEFRKCTQSFQFVPAVSVSTVTGGTPDAVYSDLTPATWTLVWKVLQDAETLLSLTDWLWLNQGTVHEVYFAPYGGTGWGAKIIVPAPPLGGDMNTWLSDTVTAAVRGKPYRIADDTTTPQQ